MDELAPRDAVARAIFRLLRETGAAAAELDMTMVDPGRFPNVVAALREAGLDPTTRRIPVAPAAHYVMGGIVTDLDGRATGVAGCMPSASAPAPGCTAPTGSPRTRSRSASSSAAARRSRGSTSRRRRPPAALGGPPGRAAHARDARSRLAPRRPRAQRCGPHRARADPHPLARLVAASALAREETRGAHARAEFPQPDAALDGRHTVIDPGAGAPRFETWP